MDYFEALVARLLTEEGYWVEQSVRVGLTKEEKRELGNPSMPRPEIDIVAYRPGDAHLLLLEAKSFLDSSGVRVSELRSLQATGSGRGRYKLLTATEYQKVVGRRLLKQWRAMGRLPTGRLSIVFGLAAGNVPKAEREELRSLALSRRWFFWGPEEIATRVRSLSDGGYENSPFVITAKVLERAEAARE